MAGIDGWGFRWELRTARSRSCCGGSDPLARVASSDVGSSEGCFGLSFMADLAASVRFAVVLRGDQVPGHIALSDAIVNRLENLDLWTIGPVSVGVAGKEGGELNGKNSSVLTRVRSWQPRPGDNTSQYLD